jgi:hypothetical protein
LLNSTYKVYLRIINQRLKAITDVLLGEQIGFRKGRSCADYSFVIKQLIEKRQELNLETHIILIDFHKAFNGVDGNYGKLIMYDNKYPYHLVQTIKIMYKIANIIINTGQIRTKERKQPRV